jgi:hypothetical protein
MAAGLETSDLVRAAAERYFERGFVEPAGSIKIRLFHLNFQCSF